MSCYENSHSLSEGARIRAVVYYRVASNTLPALAAWHWSRKICVTTCFLMPYIEPEGGGMGQTLCVKCVTTTL